MIPVNEPLLNGNEKKYLDECIQSGWISSEGPFVERFESAMASYVGRKHAIAVSNGSAALEVALKALGIGPGDEVLLPTFTIISCAAAVVRAGAVPVVVDCDPHTFNSSASDFENKITKRTKAIMVVHIYGLPCDMDPINKLANKHGLKLIEDAAEMHGQDYKGKKCGSFGEISTFSFYPNKHITTGEGGMVLTDDDEVAKQCRMLRNLCFVPEQRFIHHELGWNFRMTNMQAAIGLAQIERIDSVIQKKRFIGKLYQKLFSGSEDFQLPLEKTDYANNIYWVFPIVVKESSTRSLDEITNCLHKSGIGYRPFFWCMHEQPVFLKAGMFKNESHPHAERLARSGIYLPSGLTLTEDDIKRVVEAVLSRS